MKLIIDIPEETYNALNNFSFNDRKISVLDILYAVRCGTPLPAGHGRLIDINDIEWARHQEERNYIDYDVVDWDDIMKAPIIVEAEREEV